MRAPFGECGFESRTFRLALMVKWRSSLASTEGFRVRVLVGAYIEENGRATRQVTGTGWKPVERHDCLAGSIPAPSAEYGFEVIAPMVKRKSRLGPNEAVRVRLPVGACMVFVV